MRLPDRPSGASTKVSSSTASSMRMCRKRAPVRAARASAWRRERSTRGTNGPGPRRAPGQDAHPVRPAQFAQERPAVTNQADLVLQRTPFVDAHRGEEEGPAPAGGEEGDAEQPLPPPGLPDQRQEFPRLQFPAHRGIDVPFPQRLQEGSRPVEGHDARIPRGQGRRGGVPAGHPDADAHTQAAFARERVSRLFTHDVNDTTSASRGG